MTIQEQLKILRIEGKLTNSLYRAFLRKASKKGRRKIVRGKIKEIITPIWVICKNPTKYNALSRLEGPVSQILEEASREDSSFFTMYEDFIVGPKIFPDPTFERFNRLICQSLGVRHIFDVIENDNWFENYEETSGDEDMEDFYRMIEEAQIASGYKGLVYTDGFCTPYYKKITDEAKHLRQVVKELPLYSNLYRYRFPPGYGLIDIHSQAKVIDITNNTINIIPTNLRGWYITKVGLTVHKINVLSLNFLIMDISSEEFKKHLEHKEEEKQAVVEDIKASLKAMLKNTPSLSREVQKEAYDVWKGHLNKYGNICTQLGKMEYMLSDMEDKEKESL